MLPSDCKNSTTLINIQRQFYGHVITVSVIAIIVIIGAVFLDPTQSDPPDFRSDPTRRSQENTDKK